MAKSYSELIKDLIDASFESGYYQAVLEKANLLDSEKDLYRKLRDQAIQLRNALRDAILATRLRELTDDIDKLKESLPPSLRSPK